MTTASAADRVHRAALELRDAEIAMWKANDAYIAAYGAYQEAKALLGMPHLDVETEDPRSPAERYRDTEQARLERSDAP